MEVDERKAERRCQDYSNSGNYHPERRDSKDRRRDADTALVQQYLYNNDSQSQSTRTLLLTLLLVTMVLAWLHPTRI